MKTLVTVAIRLFVLFAIIHFVGSLGFTVISYAHTIGQPRVTALPLQRIDALELIVWLVYLGVVVLVWIKAQALTDLMFKGTRSQTEKLDFAPQILLEIGVTILAIYLVIETVPQLIIWGGNLLAVKSQFIPQGLPNQWKIREAAGVLAVILKMALAVFLIADRRIISRALSPRR